MKKWAYYLLAVLALVVITQSTALSIYDPPHNETNNIFCADCHGEALDIRDSEDNPIVSPFWDGTSSADAVYNALCLRCHNGSDAPLANSHSPGTTLIKCTICHDNHGQDQVYPGKYNKNNFFIARGTALSAVESGGVTTISYAVPAGLWATNPGSDWAADLANLAAKTDAGRGAMLVPSISWNQSRWPVFEIESIDTTTGEITVKGDASTTATELKARAADFGIFYGQQIRSIITYEGNVDYVQFYDNKGNYSFINQTAATGLCQICHTNTQHFQSTLGAAPGGDNHNADSDCSLCHQHNDVTNGGFFPSADHETDGMVMYPAPATDNCELCHVGEVISGADTHDSQCVLCHNLADYTLKLVGETGGRVAAMPDGGTSGGSDGGGTCTACHTDHLDWYYHEVDHELLGWVRRNTDTSSNTVNCAGCHDASGILTGGVHDLSGTATTQQVCNKCHFDGPATKDLRSVAIGHGNPVPGHEDHSVDPANECATCHTTYFEAHTHSHDVSYVSAVDRSQEFDDPTTGCANCHDDAGNALTGFFAIRYEHDVIDGTKDGTGACTTCHDYPTNGNQTGDADTPLESTVTSIIANNTTSTCITCHVAKDHASGASSTHGGHETTHFGWDGDCLDCHSTTNDYVVQEVHGNTCTICHSGTPSRNNEKEGDAANGIDGDAGLADGTAAAATWTTPKCTTCHPGATYSKEFIHHDRATFVSGSNNCTTNCHNTTTGHAGVHTATVSLASNCSDCHDGTKGSADNVPVGIVDNKLHDDCSACHEYTGASTGTIVLIDPATSTLVTAMPDGGEAGGTNGGGDCEACHTIGFTGFHQTVDHDDVVDLAANCANCHTGTQAPTPGPVPLDGGDNKKHDTCSTCHQADGRLSGSAAGKVGSGNGGTDGGGDCSTCHGVFDANHLTLDHDDVVDLAANCADCHTGTQAPTPGPVPLAPGDDKVHDTCSNCHEADGDLTGSAAGQDNSTVGGTDGGGNCSTCHGVFDANHLITVDHDSMVDEYANCTSCHADTDAVTGVNGGAVPLDNGDNRKHDTCSACHEANGRLTGSAAGNNGGDDGGNNGGGTCFTCHTEYFSSHTNIDHSTSVALDTNTGAKNECIDCHTGTQGSTSTVPLDPSSPAGDKKHDSCSACHENDGDLTGSAFGNDGGTADGTDGGGNCQTCHGAYFDSHTHGNDGNHDLTYSRTFDLSQDAPGTYCGVCHYDESGTSASLDTWLGILYEHDLDGTKNGTGACSTCHDYSGATTADGTPPVTNNDNTIASGTTNTCITCHTPKLQPATHGGHDNTHFGWDGDCLDCHSTTNDYVVQEVHGNTCTICHSGTPNRNNEKEGDAANGIDGDAGLADGTAAAATWTTPKCTTCHPGGTYSKEYIHHDRATFVSGSNNCTTNCHNTTTGHAGVHTATVSLASNCSDCHDGTKGSADNVPVGIVDNKLHDDCSACHEYTGASTGTIVLIDPATSTLVTAMPDGGEAGGTNGGGDCEACHTIGFTGFHQTVDHDDVVDLAANCANCHTGTQAPTPGPVPLDGGDNKKHDTCSTCHQADGRLSGSAAGKVGSGNGGTDGGGDCSTCHGVFDANHLTLDHDDVVDLAANCADCHTGTQAPTPGPVPLAPGDDKVHDTCSNCHEADGDLTGSAAGQDNSTVGGTDGGGNCSTCHGVFDANHLITVDHDSMVDEYANCTSCHADTDAVTGVNGGAVPLDNGDNRKHDTCSACHEANGRLTGSAAGNNGGDDGGNNGGGTCFTCHTEYFSSHTNIDHSTSVALDTNTGAKNECIDCHTGTQGSTSTVPLDPSSPAGDKKHDSCSACHENDGDLTGSAFGNDGGTADGTDGGGNCQTCHGAYFDSHTHGNDGNHDLTYSRTFDLSQDAPGTYCGVCHYDESGTSASLDTWLGILYEHDLDGTKNGTGACSTCHDYSGATTADGTPPVTNNDNTIASGTTNTCITCHTPKLQPATHGSHDSTHFTYDAVCLACHWNIGGNGAVVNAHLNDCTICHNGAPNRNSEKEGNPLNGIDGDARLANGTAALFDGGDANAWTDVTCLTCHPNAVAGTLPFAGIHHDSKNGQAVAGTCVPCHVGSTNGNHTGTVALATNCADCHDETKGIVNGVPIDAANDKKHDACTACHFIDATTTGMWYAVLIDPATSPLVTAMPDNGTTGGTDGGGDCEACHTIGFTGFHQTVDHDDVVDLYVNCALCHTGTEAPTPGPVPLAPADSPNLKHDTCSSCHEANGRLTGSAFGKNGATNGGTDGGGTCFTCHNEYFVSHSIDHLTFVAMNGNCINCHNGTQGTGTGVPLDPSTPAGNKKHDACSTCHDATGALTGSAVANGGGADCVTCHSDFDQNHLALDHDDVVDLATNCADCHNGTQAPTPGPVPLNAGNNKVHDACSACHEADGDLTGSAFGQDNSTVGGTDGGGNCSTCHGVFDANHLITVDHDSMVDEYANCTSCHADTDAVTGVNGGAVPLDNGDNRKHDTCSACHEANGRLTGSAAGKNGGDDGGNNGGGTCFTCHGEFFSSHANIDHSTSVDIAAATSSDIDCIDCHSGTEGSTSTVPLDPSTPAGDRKHDACSDCHDAAGALTGSAAGNDGGTSNGTDGGGECATCHTAYFDGHSHSHTTAYNNTIDRSQTGGAANECADCHDDASNVFAVFDDIRYEHDVIDGTKDASGGCTTCHDYTTNGNLSGDPDTPLLGTVQGVISTGGTSSCVSCHVPKSFAASPSTSVHGGHAPDDFKWVAGVGSIDSCGAGAGTWCHDSSTITNVVGVIHDGDWAATGTGYGNTCQNCHDNANGGDGTTQVGPNGDGDATKGSTGTPHTDKCTVCHGATGSTTADIAAIHHDRTEAIGGYCIDCHKPDIDSTTNGDARTRTVLDIAMPRNLACNYCHLYFAGWANDLSGGYETSGGKVKIFDNRFDPNTNNGRLPTVTEVVSHTISTNTTTPISDYAACFACHGRTGAGTVGDNTNNPGVADKIGPFHGMGVPYTGDSNASGGDANDVINAYSGPQVAMVWGEDSGGNNPVKSVPFHPGWNSLNWLACEVGYACGGTKPYAHDESPGWHKDDLGLRDPATSSPVGTTSFNIPWDNYAATNPAAPQSISKNFGLKGTSSKSTIVPLVALNLSSTLPTNSLKTVRSGTGVDGNKNGDPSLGQYAYIDRNAPYPATSKNNGTVTAVDFHTIINDGGTLTIFTCENVTATSCTVTAVGDYNISDGVNTLSPGLTIKPGGVVGYWVNSGGGATTPDKSNSASGHPSATGAIRRTAGTVSKPTASSTVNYAADPTGDLANFGARITTLPY